MGNKFSPAQRHTTQRTQELRPLRRWLVIKDTVSASLCFIVIIIGEQGPRPVAAKQNGKVFYPSQSSRSENSL